MDLANKVKNGGTEYIEIDDTQIALTSENLLVTMQGKEGFAFAGEGEIGVVLDKINLYVAENEMLEAIVKKFENEIMKETLTEAVLYNEKRDTYTEVTINGEKLMLDVEVR